MKHYFFLPVFLLLSCGAFAQDYMTKIAQQSCDCLDQIADTLNAEAFNLQFGLCVLEAAAPYSKELKRDHDIDFKNIDKEAEALGTLVGLQMYSVCPNAFLRINKRTGGTVPEPVEAQPTIEIIQGKAVAVQDDVFVTISIQDENGKIARFFWMNFIQSDPSLVQNYKTLEGKQLQVVYHTENFFDPKIREYRDFNIIERLDIMP